ncbi:MULTISPECIES: hypothetical protein [Okeania]|uniref:hypothetical protein n=1 Tax=Okeania TaxID=1458928 RepID=UPI0013752B1C|nr:MULTISPECIES: hypothetical protein [Okeania]NES87777.1 hypothetical protein [Okeania sp. SIO2B9]NET11843.1 hypothetical protein [Okeania sp. SIO1H6]NEP72732.1 hypothetical protein [Okeania sp. SIO2G5]NEP93366.1 hypothetical protein [Okeania sp. SIO2F5]NEQ91378.1 hypothetical protein [Okeania sp. SIO2G4]
MGRWGDGEMGRWERNRNTSSLLVDWIWRGDPFLQTRSEDRHPTLREAPLFPRSYSANISRSVNGVVRQQNDRFLFIGAEAIVADIIR